MPTHHIFLHPPVRKTVANNCQQCLPECGNHKEKAKEQSQTGTALKELNSLTMEVTKDIDKLQSDTEVRVSKPKLIKEDAKELDNEVKQILDDNPNVLDNEIHQASFKAVSDGASERAREKFLDDPVRAVNYAAVLVACFFARKWMVLA